MKFVIFHGSLGSNERNWFPDLKNKLESMGQEVISPQFPIDEVNDIKKEASFKTKQNINSWTKTFEKEVLPLLIKKDKICFVGHSLGNVFILHLIDKFKIKLDCAIFVSPCLDKLDLVPWYYDKVNTTFYKTDFDFNKLKKYIPTSYVIYSDNDPYIQPSRALHFAKVLDSSHIMIKKAGHMNSEVNMNEFPLVFELCVSRLDLDLYQRYIYTKNTDESVKKIMDANNKYVVIPPNEINDEGRFHFMNLSKSGFATFPTDTKDFKPKDEYFIAGRMASKRGILITRIFIIKNKSDLEREDIIEQINLDIESGIEVRLIDYNVLKNINCEEDFGIWDNEYVCILKRDNKGKLLEGILDSRVKTLLTAQNWKDRILRQSILIKSLKEVFKYKVE